MDPNTSYPDLVAAAVRDAIADANTSSYAVAKATGIAHVTLQRRLSGSPFTVSELDTIARHLSIPVESLSAPRRAA